MPKMIVICINSETLEILSSFRLTLGKIYECQFTSTFYSYPIIADDGKLWYCPKHFFLTLEEYRNKRLKKLDI
jgi:hypothetical protein